MATKATSAVKTQGEKVLLAMYRASGANEESMPYADIVVQAWIDYPETFALDGYPEYPDASDIHKKLYGYLKTNEFVESTGNKWFRLTGKGIEQARLLADDHPDANHQTEIAVEVDLTRPAAMFVRDILGAAGMKASVVAHHLVGATLEILLIGSNVDVANQSYTAADELLPRLGNFTVNDTVFHVTMSPTQPVILKCAGNIASRQSPYLLVPEQFVEMSRGLTLIQGIENQIVVVSIEQFVGQNIDEMTGFSRGQLGTMFRLLLETYNTRVQAVETDPSLLIEIPENLS